MKLTFILKNGEEREVSFSEGETILRVAEQNDIPLHGACEGFGVCGGCHVIIENLYDKLPDISDVENDGLDKAKNVKLRSRLACQIILNSSLDGLRVRLV